MKKLTLAITILVTALPTFANTTATHKMVAPVYKDTVLATTQWWSPERLYVGVGGGYGVVDGMMSNDGHSAFERLTIGLDAYDWNILTFGLELGVQNGNTMRYPYPTEPITDVLSGPPLGDLPIQTTLKPIVDLLVTLKAHLTPDSPYFALLKGGIAYRQWQVEDRDSIPTLNHVNAELQAGIGYEITKNIRLTAYYQGIYAGSNAGLSVNAVAQTGTFARIPTQQAGFLGLEFKL